MGSVSRILLGPVQMTSASIAHASVTKEVAGWGVLFTMTKNGSALLDEVNREDFHDVQAVVFNGVVVTAPIVAPSASSFTSFDGSEQIGMFSRSEANQITHAVNDRR